MQAGREHLHVTVFGGSAASATDDVRAALEEAVEIVKADGFDPRHIVRSRIFARDRALRQIAGDLRLEVLAGALRGASSSYIDPDRLPGGAALRVDLVALRAPSGAMKRVHEYDPVIAPPMFATLDGMVYLSGMTDTSPGFEAQLARIAGKIAAGLSQAGTTHEHVVAVNAFVARSVNMDDALASVTEVFPRFDGPLTLSPVEGFTTPEKRIEIETTARA